MARPTINLDAYKDEIIRRTQSSSYTDTLTWLQEAHGIKLTRSTLYRRLREWEQPLVRQRVDRSEDTVNRIRTAFLDHNAKDKEIQQMLSAQGINLPLHTLQRLRIDQGLYRLPCRNPRSPVDYREMVNYRVAQDLQEGRIAGLGYRAVQKHLRRDGILIGMKYLQTLMRRLDPERVAERHPGNRYERRKLGLPPIV